MTNFRSETGYTKAAPIVAEQIAAASAATPVSNSLAGEATVSLPIETKPEELKDEIKDEERDEPELILEVVSIVAFRYFTAKLV